MKAGNLMLYKCFTKKNTAVIIADTMAIKGI